MIGIYAEYIMIWTVVIYVTKPAGVDKKLHFLGNFTNFETVSGAVDWKIKMVCH